MMRSLKNLGYSFYKRLFKDKTEAAIFLTAFLVEIAFGLYLVQRWGFTFDNSDAISHLYIPRTVFDNGPNSNFANLGTVWLPMFHLLVMPLALIDTLYTTGFAGTIVNALATGGICIVLYRLVDKGRLGILASALFLCNAFTLIYGATPMTEQITIFFMVLAIYFFKNYWEKDDLVEFMKCSLALLFGTLTRYEIWAVALPVTTFFLIKELRGRRFHRLAYIHFPFWGILAWLFWNLAIFRDPLMFLHHPLGMGQRSSLTPFYYKGSAFLTTTHVLTQCFMFSGSLILVAIFSATGFLIRRKLSRIVVVLFLTSPIFIHYYLTYVGSSWAQTRFFYIAFPGLIVTVLSSVKDVKRWLKPALVGLVILVSLSYPMQLMILTTGSSDVIPSIPSMHFDVTYPIISKRIHEVKAIHEKVNGSLILMGEGIWESPAFSIFTCTSPSSIVDAYDGPLYMEAMDRPWDYVSFVVIVKSIDPLLESLNDYYGGKHFVYSYYNDETWRTEFLKHYTLVLETEHFRVFSLGDENI